MIAAMVISAGMAYASSDLVVVEPTAVETDLPSWVGQPTLEKGSTVQSWSIPLMAQSSGRALAVTVIYKDGSGGFLRVIWNGILKQMTLSDNLLEGVEILNRRTILLSQDDLKGDGRLVFQSDRNPLPIVKVILEWVDPASLYASKESVIPFLLTAHYSIGQGEASSAPIPASSDSWKGEILIAVLQDQAVPWDSQTAFSGNITKTGARSLLEMEVAGLLPEAQPSLWINNKFIGWLHVDVPDLWDPAWVNDSTNLQYAGWRKAKILLPSDALNVGQNIFQFTWKDQNPAALRKLKLQIAYPPVSTNTNSITNTVTQP